MTIPRRVFLAGAAAAALLPKLLRAQSAAAELPTQQLLTDKMKDTGTPGMTALVMRDFQVERELIAGVRRLGAEAPVLPGDRWHLGSNGKAMTATLVARLVERGVLAWDRTLAEMLPQFAESMHESYRDVTLPELLSHRSGLPHDLSESQDAFHYAFHDDDAPLPAQRLRYVDRALRDPPKASKRTAFSYSNTGFILAAACAEAATGTPFEALMDSEVFAPLGIRSASFAQVGGADEPIGHRDGRIGDRPRDTMPRMFVPAGGIRMSLPDWARFCIDHMQGAQGRGKLLRGATYRFLHAPQGDTGFAALGWGFVANVFGRRGPALFHAGSDGNWESLVMLFQETGNGVLVAANAAGSMRGDRAANEVMRAIVPLIAEAEPEAKP